MNFDEKAAEVIFHNSKTTLFCLYGSNKETAAPFLVESIFAIIKFLFPATFIANSSYFGASDLQWPHQGA